MEYFALIMFFDVGTTHGFDRRFRLFFLVLCPNAPHTIETFVAFSVNTTSGVRSGVSLDNGT